MTSMSISKELELHFLGRNGLGRMCGARVVPIEDLTALHIEPVTSRGVAGRCSIQIPVGQLHQFVEALQSAAAEITLGHAARPAINSERLTFEFGHWGEHPQYGRADWKYEVANGDTQRGYWDYVAAKLEEEDAEGADSSDQAVGL
jgi:hypothetical protein